MKILSITAQKPHSTGSGVYLTELVNAFDRLGHSQAVSAGICKVHCPLSGQGIILPGLLSERLSPLPCRRDV